MRSQRCRHRGDLLPVSGRRRNGTPPSGFVRVWCAAFVVVQGCAAPPTPPEPTPPAAICGDGVRQPSEQCDDGPLNGSEVCGCQVTCRWAYTSVACDDHSFCTTGEACDGAGRCSRGVPLDCWDADPCTVDRCDDAASLCTHRTWEGPVAAMFDGGVLGDASTLGTVVEDTWSMSDVGVEGADLRFRSFERQGCRESPIFLFAEVAWPAGSLGPRPAVVWTSDIDGASVIADRQGLARLAARLGAVVVRLDGPGLGQSEGLAPDSESLLATVPDARNGWWWAQGAASWRAITWLATRPDVDLDRVFLAGEGVGGVPAWHVAVLDDRVAGWFGIGVPFGVEDSLRWTTGADGQPTWTLAAPWLVELFGTWEGPAPTFQHRWDAWMGTWDPAHSVELGPPPSSLLWALAGGYQPWRSAAGTSALPDTTTWARPQLSAWPATALEDDLRLADTALGELLAGSGPGTVPNVSVSGGPCPSVPCTRLEVAGTLEAAPTLWWTATGGWIVDGLQLGWDGASWVTAVPGHALGEDPHTGWFLTWPEAGPWGEISRSTSVHLAPQFERQGG